MVLPVVFLQTNLTQALHFFSLSFLIITPFSEQNMLGGWRRNLMRKTICASIFRLLFTCSEILFLSAPEAQMMVYCQKKPLSTHSHFQRCSQCLQLWQGWQCSDLSGFSPHVQKKKLHFLGGEQPQNNPPVVLLLS